MKVSVIIPVYNAQPFIRQCVGSVLNQTWKDLEVIMIDDGSRDESLNLCRELCRADKRVRILTQENNGVSSARNRGLEAAKGDYVFFLDSDDAIHPLLLEEMVRQAEAHQAELVFCSYIRQNSAKMGKMPDSASPEDLKRQVIVGERSEAEEWFHQRYQRELSCIGGKMIKRGLIGAERFNESLFNGEDTVFMYRLISRWIKMVYCCQNWYYYRIHSESLSYRNKMIWFGYSFKAYEIIRDQEFRNGNLLWAAEWEYRYVWDILTKYLIIKNKRDKDGSEYLKNRMLREMRHPLYRKFSAGRKVLFGALLFGCTYFSVVRRMWMAKKNIVIR